MHVTTGTRWLRSLAIAATLLGAAACSSDPPPAGSVSTSTPTLTTSSPTPTATPVAQQVEDAVRAYYAELTRAAQTNDTTRLKPMLAKSCPCYRAVRVIEAGARQGQKTPDANWSVDALRVHDITGQAAVADVKYRVSGYNVIDKSGDVIDHISPHSSHFDLSLIQFQRRWVVANVFDLEGR